MDLKDHLEIERNHVRNIAETIHQSGMENNNLIEEMSRDPSDSALKSIRNSFDTAQKVSAEMKSVERDSADIKDATFKLKRKLTSLEPDWDSKLSFAEENGERNVFFPYSLNNTSCKSPVTKTVSNIRTANSILESLESISEKNNEKMKIWNETISSQLKALKDKIAQAKHIAEGVRKQSLLYKTLLPSLLFSSPSRFEFPSNRTQTSTTACAHTCHRPTASPVPIRSP